MRNLLIIYLLFLFYSANATVYHIGPSQTYTSFNNFHAAIGWHNLVAGDEVKIYYKTEPYREFMFLSGKGTVSQHIKITGVLGPNGERPIIDGENAIQPSTGFKYQDFNNFVLSTDGILDLANGNPEPDPLDPNAYTYYANGLYQLGLIVVGRPLGSDWLDSPAYIDIENLEIRNARENYQFKPHFSGQVGTANPYNATYNLPWKNFPGFTAGIWVQRCQNIEIRNCYIHDCGNGLFINSQAFDNGNGTIANLISKNVLIEKNDIQNNGCSSGGFSCHNIYSEASQTTYQYNRIGKKYAGSRESNCLKDRGAGTIIRFNWFDATNQAHILDLVEAEASADMMVNEPNYHDSYVYGNVFINPPTGPTTPFHYGGDHGNYALYRQGTLHFWNNTFINISDQYGSPNARWRMSMFLFPMNEVTGVSTFNEVLEAQNNIIVNKAENVGANPSDFYIVTCDGNATYHLSNNWISQGVQNGFSGYWDNSSNSFRAFTGIFTNTNTFNNTQNNPGFVNINTEDFHLVATSPCINMGIYRPEITQEYVKELKFVTRSSNSTIDLGAFEYTSNSSNLSNCIVPKCGEFKIIK